MKYARLCSSNKSSGSLILLPAVLTWPRQRVSHLKTNKTKEHNLNYLQSVFQPSGALHLPIVSRPLISHKSFKYPRFLFFVWNLSPSPCVHVCVRRKRERAKDRDKDINERALQTPTALSMGNTAVMKVRFPNHCCPTYCMTPITKTILHSLQLNTDCTDDYLGILSTKYFTL